MNNLIIVDDLRRDVAREDYEDGCARFRELSNNCGIVDERIGFFGAVSYPGISDIDGLVVANSIAIRRLKSDFSEARRNSATFSYLFWHDPVYVLEDAWEEAQSLHTLNGLKFLAYSKDFQGMFDARQVECNWLLHVVWFTCLSSFVSVLSLRGGATLRALLLVQKNLEYSLKYFSEACGSRLNFPMPSEELRESVFMNPNSDKQWVADLFLSQFGVVCEAFDHFCQMASQRIQPYGRFGRWQLANRRTLIKNSSKTSLTTIGRFSVLETNSLAFSLASSFWSPKVAPLPIADYLRTLYRTRDIYRKHGLHNEFNSPFAMSVGGKKASVMRAINRLARVLT